MVTNEWVVGRPGQQVRPFVERYVGYRMAGYEPAVHRGLPSRYLTFIVSIGHPIAVMRQTSDAQAPRTYRSALGGLHATPALISHDGNQEGVAVELTPMGSRALFGIPAGALSCLTLELAEVVGSLGDELWERLQSTSDWGERFAACDTVLARSAGADETPAELAGSWRVLAASHGMLSIDALARHVGYSRQHLSRRFREEFGLGPKLAARIIRFDRANRMLRAPPTHASLAEVAAVCGYADQSHLTREFTAFAGCPPARWVRDEEVPILQDEGPSGVRA